MAAIRGPKQKPSQGDAFTTADWNTMSVPSTPTGAYQWVKAQAERLARDICGRASRPHGMRFGSVLPCFLLGPAVRNVDVKPGFLVINPANRVCCATFEIALMSTSDLPRL
eukprot:CAMPEP_0114538552 /NCGR_PEP_ID=MMETSP0109-20121206/30207_1 /TAXON_ID=29199 /ORGANISM="Chlorarachnion reptans, Strain CCCM449" /LENGTH=110 /DNA_ID=CAMNT_0001722585 /DNA_START=152 /DNA_END=484 /DNA_ORIENTATION=-